MATTLDNLIGMVMFPLIMLIGVAAFVSTMGAKGMEEMTVDDWISAVLAGSTVMVGGSFHVLPMNQGEAGTAAICILMPFGGLGVLGLHMVTQILEPQLGAFLPRLILSPVVLYGIIRAWRSLLGMELTVFNVLLVLWVGLIAAGWVAAGWFLDVGSVAVNGEGVAAAEQGLT